MQRIISILFTSLILIGCGDTGSKAMKGAAQAVLADDKANSQVAPTPSPVTQVQLQTTPPVKKPKPVDIPIEGIIAEGYIMTSSDRYVFMRNAPASSATKTLKLHDNTPVSIISCEGSVVRGDNKVAGSWCKVLAKGQIGYVFDKYIIQN